MDQPREAIDLRLAPQVADVDVERVGVDAEVVAPDAIEDHVARQHLTGVAHEQLEQLVLRARQFDRLAGAARAVRPRIELQIVELQRLRSVSGYGAPDDRAQTGEQFFERKRLYE